MVTPLSPQKRVIVGLSGGVDSSLSAYLLQQEGYEVIGLFMKNWDEKDNSGYCTAAQDYEDMTKVCNHLQIPYYTVDFVDEYWERVFAPSIEIFKRGETPNPDILCNREIKFKTFFEEAISLGADYVATGHYVRRHFNEKTNHYELMKGKDPKKDQSYFLYTIKSHILEKVLFPIGELEKGKVRELALFAQIPTHAKKDSTGICFIGERPFSEFLENYIPRKTGEFRHLSGEVVGIHQGAHFYTLGQRKGLGLGGQGDPWFVVAKDIDRNVVYVERGHGHPALLAQTLWCDEVMWVAGRPPFQSFPYTCQAKVRYRQSDQKCHIIEERESGLVVTFEDQQRAVTPGQSIVFYQGDVCLGGGTIRGLLAV